MMTAVRGQAEGRARPPLVSRPLLIRFVSVAGVSVSFYLMLSVVPLFVRSAGASTNVAGLATTVLSLSTIAGYLPTPRLVTCYGHRVVLAAGMLLLGMPALVLAVTSNLTIVLLACAVRGIGFAITCVSGGALTVSLIPPQRRGEGLALIGVVSGVPSVVALPLGVWLAGHAGFPVVFVVAATAALAPMVTLPWLPASTRSAGGVRGRTPAGSTRSRIAASDSMLAGLRTPALIRPALIFFSATMAIGIFVTFVPLAASRADAGVAELALFIQPAAMIGGRWLAGRLGDRAGAVGTGRSGRSRLLIPGVLIAAAGIGLLSLSAFGVATGVGALLFGTGFGMTGNASLTLMYDLVPDSGFSMVSALWNLAYDSGMGIGAAWFGALAGRTGYPVAFGVTALVMVSATALSRGTKERQPGQAPQPVLDKCLLNSRACKLRLILTVSHEGATQRWQTPLLYARGRLPYALSP